MIRSWLPARSCFLAVCNVLRLVGVGPAPRAEAVEIAVLRRLLAILRRQAARRRYQPMDRLLLAWLSRWRCCVG
jgi:hypothetical protein